MPSVAVLLRNVEKLAFGQAHRENLTCGANQACAEWLPRLEDRDIAMLSKTKMSSRYR